MNLSIHHIVFAALMHDVGKVIQRSGASDVPKYLKKCREDPKYGYLTYKHAMWTADFLDRYPLKLPEKNWESIVELASSHHCKDSWELHNYDHYLDMIMQADNISSSWDREKPEESSTDKQRYLKAPLYSVFSKISTGENTTATNSTQWTYPLQKLTPDNAFPKESNDLIDQSAAYKALFDSFKKDYSTLCEYYNELAKKNIATFEREHCPQFIDAVDSLLKTYFWCVPANTMESTPIGSLYHHLHNSAAISAALYAQDECKEQSEPPFMIIAADLNGIQNYLYDLNPENSSKASKLLRSRSFQIQMIMEMLADKVINELGLSHLSIISSQGGKWFILANNSKENRQKLEEVKRTVNAEMFTRFLGLVSINLSWETKLGLADLRKEHFINTMNRVYEFLEKEKMNRFSAYLQKDNQWQTENFVINHDNLYSDQLCDFCKRRNSDKESSEIYQKYESPEEENPRVCHHCLQEINLGRNLAADKNKLFKIWQGEEDENTYIHFAGMNFSPVKADEADELKGKVHYFCLSEENENLQIPKRYLATQVPIKNGKVSTFDEIAKHNEGLQANAVMKGDVDNLGYIISRGWQKDDSGNPICSITEYSTLSFMLDYFFSAYLPALIKKQYQDSIYTIYSGGDDFCLIGAYEKVIAFASELNEKFNEFCAKNPDIHFSAAITLAHSKEPIKFSINSTELRLKDAKAEADKNSLHLYETIVKWNKLPDLLDFASKLKRWLDQEELTLQFLYRLLTYHQMYLETLNKENVNYRNFLYESLLNYDIKRNIEKMKDNKLTNPEIVNKLRSLTGLEEGNTMKYLRIPLCHTIYKNRKKTRTIKTKENNNV